MKKRIIVALSLLLVLFSFVSCNLDNSGILYGGPELRKSDNKNRNFLGVIGDDIYITTTEGLERLTTDGNESVIKTNAIFDQYSQDVAVVSEDNIIYMDDSVQNESGVQNFYLIGTDGSVTGLETSGADGKTFVDAYTDGNNSYFAADDGSIYSVTLNAKTLSFTDTNFQNTSSDKEFYAYIYGVLIMCTTNDDNEVTSTSAFYNGKEITGYDGTIRSAYVDSDTIYLITEYDDTFRIYTGSTSGDAITVTQHASTSGSFNQTFPMIVANGMIYFLDYNTSGSSTFIAVDSTGDKPSVHRSNPGSDIMAEALVEINGSVYVLTKDHGLYYVTTSNGIDKVRT